MVGKHLLDDSASSSKMMSPIKSGNSMSHFHTPTRTPKGVNPGTPNTPSRMMDVPKTPEYHLPTKASSPVPSPPHGGWAGVSIESPVFEANESNLERSDYSLDGTGALYLGESDDMADGRYPALHDANTSFLGRADGQVVGFMSLGDKEALVDFQRNAGSSTVASRMRQVCAHVRVRVHCCECLRSFACACLHVCLYQLRQVNEVCLSICLS